MEQDGRCPRSADTGRYHGISALRLHRRWVHSGLGSIVIDRWQVIESHEDGESEEGPELLNCVLSPRSVCLLSHYMSSVVVALTHNVFLQIIVKK